jgi:tRNA pseudouridine55 synthase
MNTKPPYQFEDGALFLVDKPLNWTSFDVVNKLRYALKKVTGNKKIKVGHAGTLDPLATGLLLVCCGKYTKQIDNLQAMTKEYTGTIKLGAVTPSFDAETKESNPKPFDHLSEEDIKKATEQFLGEIEQVPPIYSAIKVDGKALYELARKGQEVEIKSRKVQILFFEITSVNLPSIDFRVSCSKGTYIRSLANDLGQSLGCGGYLTALRRTKIGDYCIEEAWNLEHLESGIRESGLDESGIV